MDLSITAERVTAAGTDAESTAAQLGSEIERMREILGDVRAGWQSDKAAPSYLRAMEAHLTTVTQLKAALVSHGTTLVSSGRRIAQTDDELAIGGAR